VGFALDGVDDGFGDARFADAGFAAEQDDLAFAGLGLLPALDQQREFLVAADQRGDAAGVAGGEAAFQGAFAEDGIGRGRLGDAL
jgi:hypothetical protein